MGMNDVITLSPDQITEETIIAPMSRSRLIRMKDLAANVQQLFLEGPHPISENQVMNLKAIFRVKPDIPCDALRTTDDQRSDYD